MKKNQTKKMLNFAAIFLASLTVITFAFSSAALAAPDSSGSPSVDSSSSSSPDSSSPNTDSSHGSTYSSSSSSSSADSQNKSSSSDQSGVSSSSSSDANSVQPQQNALFKDDINEGTRSNDVIELQNELTRENIYHGPITGYFGPLTKAAVTEFQREHSIPATGYVDAITRGELNSLASGAVLGASTTAGLTNAQMLQMIQNLQNQLDQLVQQLKGL